MTDSQSFARPRLRRIATWLAGLTSWLLASCGSSLPNTPSSGPVAEAPRRVFSYDGVVHVAPSTVFPLLCPVREYDWLDEWRVRMLFTQSGVAEEGAVFVTKVLGEETWIMTRYEPPLRAQYVVFAGGAAIMVLDLALEPTKDGTTLLHWRRSYTALSWLGRHIVGRLSDREVGIELRTVHASLVYYLETGKMLRKRAAEERARDMP